MGLICADVGRGIGCPIEFGPAASGTRNGLISFKSGGTFGFPVDLHIGLPDSAAEVIEEREPGGDDQHCKADETDGRYQRSLISLEC